LGFLDAIDVEGRILPKYLSERIVSCSPFRPIDREGVGVFVDAWPSQRARKQPPPSRLGVCR